MSEVWKYNLGKDDETEIAMPTGAQVLSAGIQNERDVVIWALVDPQKWNNLNREIRTFRVAGTGHPINYATSPTFIGTVQMLGVLWFHVFEVYS